MKVWNEATTTSPSGLHLGHHKCLIREIDIRQEGSGLSDKAIEALEDLESIGKKMTPSPGSTSLSDGRKWPTS
jgi:hypothetical protein